MSSIMVSPGTLPSSTTLWRPASSPCFWRRRLCLEPLEIRMLEDRGFRVEIGRGIVERPRKSRHEAIHVSHLGNKTVGRARLPVLSLVAHGNAKTQAQGLLERRHDRKMAPH